MSCPFRSYSHLGSPAHVGGHETRGHQHHVDPKRLHLHAHAPGDGVESVLGGRVDAPGGPEGGMEGGEGGMGRREGKEGEAHTCVSLQIE